MTTLPMIAQHPACYYNRSCKPMFIALQVPVDWAVPMYGYVMPFIVTLTLATNSFIVVVLSHKYLRTPTNYVLLAMAVSELLTGLSCMPWFTYYYTLSGYKVDLQYGLPPFWCTVIPYMATFFPSIFHMTAIWLTVYLAIQRYVYICVPTLVRRFCTIHRSKQVISAICLISASMYLPDLFAAKHESHAVFDMSRNRTLRVCYRMKTPLVQALGDDIYYHLTFSAQTILVHFIPCVLLVIFTWKLVRAIRLADKRHAHLLSKYPSNRLENFRSTKRKMSEMPSMENENRLSRLFKQRESVSEPRRAHGLKQNTRMLVVVILLFLITEIPAAIIFGVHVISVSLRLKTINYQLLNVLLIIRNVLIVVSYPFRFAIYCGMSQQFRDVVRQMFTGKMPTHAIRDKDNSTTIALVQGGTDNSDEKRQSVVLCSGNGTLMSALSAEARMKVEYRKDKAVQCDPASEDDFDVPFDPFLADLSELVEAVGSPAVLRETETTRECSTQCGVHINNEIYVKRKSSLLRAALKENTILCQAVASHVN
ncbi:unnamed protein product [Caenorhabditis auriculariae]|uniref:G-protein coupled receptors family 1 profile domain-containing protein n=1 Tax=Caenorhabditis auriculariae TaxID=2777116 RepID=A0A8S1H6V3_9PELO|nr:unnamed protein product [Caenorhabditis auriculariae]